MNDNEAAEVYETKITNIRKVLGLLNAEANSGWNAHYYDWMDWNRNDERWEGTEQLDEIMEHLRAAYGILTKHPRTYVETVLTLADELESTMAAG